MSSSLQSTKIISNSKGTGKYRALARYLFNIHHFLNYLGVGTAPNVNKDVKVPIPSEIGSDILRSSIVLRDSVDVYRLIVTSF